jgi:hypothetical protein
MGRVELESRRLRRLAENSKAGNRTKYTSLSIPGQTSALKLTPKGSPGPDSRLNRQPMRIKARSGNRRSAVDMQAAV